MTGEGVVEHPRPRVRARTKILLVVLATLVAALLSEFFLRIFGVAKESVPIRFMGGESASMSTVPDSDLFWRLAPGKGAEFVADIGVRGDAFSSPRSDRDFRVLCIGDSCTYGLQARPNETWAQILDRRIQADVPFANVETVQAATPGYSTWQNLAFVRRHGAVLGADVTILFVGVWNDMLPAANLRDSEYAAEIARLERHPFWSLRLGRVLWRALHPLPTVDDMKRRMAGKSLNELTNVARVSLGEFRDNVKALVAFGRAGGAVLGIIPSPETANAIDWTPEYRRTLVDVYRELGVPCIDEKVAFRSFGERHADLHVGEKDCIQEDRIHPTPTGHRALAEALEPLVLEAAAARIGRLRAEAPPDGPMIASFEPGSIPPGLQATLRARGRGFTGPAPPRRVFVNDQTVRDIRIVDDTTLEFDVEPDYLCKPGKVAIAVRSRAGSHLAETCPVVSPWAFNFTSTEDAAGRTVRLSVETTSSLALFAWFSTELLSEPHPSRWGSFRLKDPAKPHPESAFLDPLTLEGLSLPKIVCIRPGDDPKPAGGEVRLPEAFAKRGAPLYAQVLVRWGWALDAAWLSDVIEIR